MKSSKIYLFFDSDVLKSNENNKIKCNMIIKSHKIDTSGLMMFGNNDRRI